MAEPRPASRRAVRRADVVPVDWDHLAEMAEEGMTAAAGPLFEAQYGGTCRGHGGRWEPGDLIAWSNDEDRFVCADCAQQAGQ